MPPEGGGPSSWVDRRQVTKEHLAGAEEGLSAGAWLWREAWRAVQGLGYLQGLNAGGSVFICGDHEGLSCPLSEPHLSYSPQS